MFLSLQSEDLKSWSAVLSSVAAERCRVYCLGQGARSCRCCCRPPTPPCSRQRASTCCARAEGRAARAGRGGASIRSSSSRSTVRPLRLRSALHCQSQCRLATHLKSQSQRQSSIESDRLDPESPIGWVLNKGRVPADHTWFGHLIDDVVSNTYRALRFVDDPTYKDLLYAEFTSQPDWHYENPVHYELFNVRAHALPCACCWKSVQPEQRRPSSGTFLDLNCFAKLNI